jgi:hydroxyacylglutathione hydrolase
MRTFWLSIRFTLIVAVALLPVACAGPKAATNHTERALAVATSPANSVAPLTAPASQNAQEKVKRIEVDEAKKLVAEGRAILVDVRGAESYKASHIKGAIDFPLDKLEAGDFKGLPKDKRIITYCACGAEQTSARAAILLEKAGFKDAAALLGGIHAWERAGGPIEKANRSQPGEVRGSDSGKPRHN